MPRRICEALEITTGVLLSSRRDGIEQRASIDTATSRALVMRNADPDRPRASPMLTIVGCKVDVVHPPVARAVALCPDSQRAQRRVWRGVARADPGRL